MNKFNSIFGQILGLFSRVEFEKMVRQTGAEKGAKGFTSWGHFVAMLFCQLGQAHSLREICNGLGSCFGKLRHLGISGSPKRSTLAYANEHRPWELFQGLFYELLGRCQREFQTIGRRFRFKNKLMSFDATVIELCAAVFDWARFRRTKGAVKLHLLLDHSGYLPEYAHVTEGRVHEVNVLKGLQLSPGAIVAIDRGCLDYGLFGKWTAQG
ncbi:MAG: IS4 family transposase, partial [Candidatus Brocadiales bacterium]